MISPAAINGADRDQTVRPRAADQARLLSLGQERLWYLDQLTPGSPVYNVPFTARLHGMVDANALERALNHVVQRHEVLRTVILPIRGTPRPVLLKKWELGFDFVDLRAMSSSEGDEHLQAFVAEQARRPFDLARHVMLRCALLRTADNEYVFVLTAPHLAFEGSSLPVLFDEIAACYSADLERRPVSLPGLPLQYADFAAWQRGRLTGVYLESLTEYWKRQVSGGPVLDLPHDFPRPAIKTMRGKRHFFAISPDLLSRAQQVFQALGVSRFCGLLSAFYVLLYRYTGSTDLCVGSPFRPRCTGIEGLIGFFVNTVVLRASVPGHATFRNLSEAVNRTLTSAIAHSDLTLDKVVEAVQPDRDPSRTPLFQVNFRAPKQPFPSLNLIGVQSERAQYMDNGTAKFDLALEIDASEGKACYFEYSTDLFSKPRIERAVCDFQTLLVALVEQPDIPLEELRNFG